MRIDPAPDHQANLLPDVLRQLTAMVKLLSDMSENADISKVQVLLLSKESPLRGEFRVVNVRERPATRVSPKKQLVRAIAKPVRRLEGLFDTIGEPPRRNVDVEGLTAVSDFAKQLRGDVATLETDHHLMVVDPGIIAQIDRQLGPILQSRGSVSGVLEGLNIHTRPWRFYVYPEIGPKRIQCTFPEELFPIVHAAIRHRVTVFGLKEHSVRSPWPIRMHSQKIEVREEAPPGAWLSLLDEMSALWEDVPEEERDYLLQVHGA